MPEVTTYKFPERAKKIIQPRFVEKTTKGISGESFEPRGTKTPQHLISVKEDNQLKRDFYNQISDPAFLKKIGELSESPEMYRRSAQGLRKEIIGGVPEAGKLDKSASIAIKAQKALKSEEARSLGRIPLPFFEATGAGTALIFGQPGIAALIAARRLATSPYALSQGARGLLNLSKQKALGAGARVGTSEFGRRIFGG